jgi:hypothetical protein
MEGWHLSPALYTDGGVAPYHVIAQRREGLTRFEIPLTHGNA